MSEPETRHGSPFLQKVFVGPEVEVAVVGVYVVVGSYVGEYVVV